MRLSHCESYCASPLCYIPCLRKSKDAGSDAVVSAAPCSAGVAAEDKPPPVQKIEAAAAAAEKNDDEDKKVEDCEKKAVPAAAAAPAKSNLKKANCGDGVCAAKGNVKWLDLLGKDLTEVKEFEPSESGDSMDEGDGIAACVCVIQ